MGQRVRSGKAGKGENKKKRIRGSKIERGGNIRLEGVMSKGKGE